jgi:hypothetical protein
MNRRIGVYCEENVCQHSDIARMDDARMDLRKVSAMFQYQEELKVAVNHTMKDDDEGRRFRQGDVDGRRGSGVLRQMSPTSVCCSDPLSFCLTAWSCPTILIPGMYPTREI